MKLFKPVWVSHNDNPICAIDIHPDGTRFVTGGRGEDTCGRVVIWNMAPIINEAAEFDDKIPKMLCQLNNHLACVNCVRWSYSGKFLASGGDDKMVMIWVISKTSGSNVVFGSKAVNVESWRCMFTLKRHDGDVLDLAWSPHDNWLATCSVDNNVIIWDTNKFPEVVAVLKGHTGMVKGVTWDPVGKYLSSQSDDKTLRIWRTVDWQQEAVITKPFKECAGTTVVLRLGWSPDGQYLVSAHAINNQGPTAQIIEREGWKHEIDFVGHRKAVTCVRFSNSIFQRDFSRSGKLQQACCCAMGSRDRGVSVWLTALKRPLMVLEQLFSSAVLDLSWSHDGLRLMACSLDGSVAFLEFTPQEVGRPLTDSEKNALYEKTYGKSLGSGQPASAVVLENPALVVIEKKAPTVPEPSQPVPSPARVAPKPITTRQIETRTSDGRRRITPIFIPTDSTDLLGPAPFKTAVETGVEVKSKIEVEYRVEAAARNNSAYTDISSRLRMLAGPSTMQTQRPTAPFTRNLDKVLATINKQPARAPEPKPGAVTLRGGEDVGRGHNLPCPSLRPNTRHMITGSSKCLVIENEACLSPFGRYTQVRLLAAGKLQWETVLGSTVCTYAASGDVVALGCVDGSLHVLSTPGGTRLVPVLVLGAPPVHLALTGATLLCVTGAASLSVWCLHTRRAILSDRSLQPILTGTGRLSRCSVTAAGVPTIVLDSGRAFMYSTHLNTWLRLADNTDVVVRNTQRSYQSAWLSLPDSGPTPLRSVQALCHTSLERGVVHQLDNSAQCTHTYLEDQLAICRTLNSPQEFRFWLLTHVRFLLQEGMEDKLRVVLEALMRHSGIDSDCLWDPEALGIERATLLREVLSELQASPHAQRLYLEYSDQLEAAV